MQTLFTATMMSLVKGEVGGEDGGWCLYLCLCSVGTLDVQGSCESGAQFSPPKRF